MLLLKGGSDAPLFRMQTPQTGGVLLADYQMKIEEKSLIKTNAANTLKA